MGLPKWLTSEEFTCQGGRRRRYEFGPWVRKIPWRRKWQPTPALLPGEFNGQRSLADYRPWGHKRKWTWFSDYTTTITHGSRNICFPPRASVPGWEHRLLLLLSHFSHVRLCNPIPGILQARTLEWVAISFSNALKWKVKVKTFSYVRLFSTPWTAAYQTPPSMGFSRPVFPPVNLFWPRW